MYPKNYPTGRSPDCSTELYMYTPTHVQTHECQSVVSYTYDVVTLPVCGVLSPSWFHTWVCFQPPCAPIRTWIAGEEFQVGTRRARFDNLVYLIGLPRMLPLSCFD